LIGRIFLFGSAVLSLILLTLIYAVVSGQYAREQPTPIPTPSVAEPSAGSVEPSASPSQAEPSASASGTTATVTIANTAFGPDLTIVAGTTVTFVNEDTFAHTASNGSDGTLASSALFDIQLAAGASGTYTFAEAGTYQVTCTLHPTMNMTITVQ